MELYLREEKEKREAEDFQMWIASLQSTDNAAAAATRLQIIRGQHTEQANFIAREIQKSLPPSIRILLAVPDAATAISAEAEALEFWDDLIEEFSADPDDRRAAFYQAGKDAALGGNRTIN